VTAKENRRFVLASRPTGMPTEENFRLESTEIPEPRDGGIVAKTLYLSLDPYMRGRMNDVPSYTPPVALDAIMVGGTVGQVIASRAPDLAEGDIVAGQGGWQEYFALKADQVTKVDPSIAPISTAVGVLGMPGLTAYAGLAEIGKPKEGETVVVSAAAGAVGQIVGQIAKIKGSRVVGIAGPKEKCAYVKDELGFDAAVSYRDDDFPDQLKAACPDGVDVYWENVGGPTFDAVLPLFNDFARMPVCGLIHWYNVTDVSTVPDPMPRLMSSILRKRLTVRGFIVFDLAHVMDDFVRDVGGWVRDGKMQFREDIREGFENAPASLIDLLQGGNFGKMVLRVADDPTSVG
jgi:NADPH-dependent curcumin reductase CurA